jgi:hypothetical protein
MKKILSIFAFFVTATQAFAQSNPCPTVNAYGFSTVSSSGSNCTSKVFVYVSSSVSSTKGLNIKVYEGLGTSGTLLTDDCLSVASNSVSSYLETSLFTAPCFGNITFVITSYNSSNGTCDNGSSCGNTISVMAVSGGPLPIKMTDFYAKRKNATVGLTWKTESEINAKEFVLQRKVEKDYIDVATIAATNRSNGSFYTFTDNNNYKSVSQYRLKLVDQDGEYKYSEVRIVKGTATPNDFTVFPNPSAGSTKVTVADISEPTDVQLIDISGRILKNFPMNYSNSINIHDMKNGIYMIRILNKNSGESLTKKITVLN